MQPDAATIGRPALGRSRASGRTADSARGALSAWGERRTLLLGVIVLAAALSEGSANQWLALAVVDGFSSTESVGALMLGVFVVAMTLVRLLGTRLLDAFGRVAVLRVSGVVAIAGLALFALAPSLPLAALGIAAWGAGAALAFPITVAAASDDPLRAAARVSVVTSFAAVARISAPPLLGLLGENVGIRRALIVICVALLASVLLARQVSRTRSTAPALGVAVVVGTTTDDDESVPMPTASHRARAASSARRPAAAR